VKEARSGRPKLRPDRNHPTDEERLSYRMGFYDELEVMEEDALDEEEGG
jgi:hypothetical protein